ncbi:MAG: DCL family protein [Proteobacteria bacterium]|nr:DCL family protein [Pseudomonadota bacterium]
MAKSLNLSGRRSWATQKAAKAHFGAILHRYSNGEPITNNDDHNDLLALLSAYDADTPPAEKKSGSGVEYFFRDKEPEHGGVNNCFWVRRTDGSSIDFSFHKAVEYVSRAQSVQKT